MRLPSDGPTRVIVVALGWIASAAVAGFIGITAIGAVGDGIFGSSTTPLSLDQVNDRLEATSTTSPNAQPSTPTTDPSGTTEPPPTQPPATEPPAETVSKGISTAGGNVVARCNGSLLTYSATPNVGFQAERHDDEGDGEVRVEFESDDLRIRVEMACVDGVPTHTIEVDD